MHRKQKEKVVKTVKYTWLIAGIALVTVILFSFAKIHVAHGSGTTVKTIFFAAGLYTLLIYLISTMIIILAREIIKRLNPSPVL